MARYFHRTNKTSSAAPSSSEIGEGEIAINSTSSLGGTDGSPGRLYIRMSNGEIRRFIALGLTDGFKTKYGGTNNTFSGASAPADSSADSLMIFQYSSVGNHTINNITSGRLTWNNSLHRLNINRPGTAAQANLHVGGNVRVETVSNWSGSAFNTTFQLLGRSTSDSEIYGIPSQNFISYIADGAISSSKLGVIGIDKGGLGSAISSPQAGDTLYYNSTTSSFSITSNLKWDAPNNRLGVNESSPDTTLHVNGTIRYENRPTPTGVASPLGLDGNGNILELTTIPVSEGGTGASLSPNDGDTLYYNNTNSSFASTSNLKWDSANNRLGVNQSFPQNTLHVNGGIRCLLPFGLGTNIVIDGVGDLVQDSSSKRFKEDITNYTKGLSTVILLNPVNYKYLNQNKVSAGLIAEDLADLGLEEFVIRDEEDLPKAIAYSHMVSLLINAIKELKAEVDQLKTQINS